jgi:hypothetical protein
VPASTQEFFMPRFIVLTALAALAACADSEPPDAVTVEDDGAYNLIDPVSADVASDAEPAIGEWARSMQQEKAALVFGPTGAEPLFSLRCDDREGILINRHGLVETGTAGMMTLRMGGASRQLAVNPVEGPLPMLRAAVPANDPLLAALSDYDGPVEVVVGDGAPLVLPPSPMIGEFIESCASGETPSPVADEAAADGAGNAADTDRP